MKRKLFALAVFFFIFFSCCFSQKVLIGFEFSPLISHYGFKGDSIKVHYPRYSFTDRIYFKPVMGLRYGVNFTYTIKKNYFVKSGIYSTNWGGIYKLNYMFNDSFNDQMRNQYSAIEIPLLVGYKKTLNATTKLEFGAGILYNYSYNCTSRRVIYNEYESNGSYIPYYDTLYSNFTKPLYLFNLILNFEIERKINDNSIIKIGFTWDNNIFNKINIQANYGQLEYINVRCNKFAINLAINLNSDRNVKQNKKNKKNRFEYGFSTALIFNPKVRGSFSVDSHLYNYWNLSTTSRSLYLSEGVSALVNYIILDYLKIGTGISYFSIHNEINCKNIFEELSPSPYYDTFLYKAGISRNVWSVPLNLKIDIPLKNKISFFLKPQINVVFSPELKYIENQIFYNTHSIPLFNINHYNKFGYFYSIESGILLKLKNDRGIFFSLAYQLWDKNFLNIRLVEESGLMAGNYTFYNRILVFNAGLYF